MRITNLLRKLEMKSRSGKNSIFFFFIFLCFYSHANNSFEDESYFRKSYVLEISKKGTFTNSDTLLSPLKNGKWSLKGSEFVLSNLSDSTLKAESFKVLFKSNNKIVLEKEGKRFSYHDRTSSEGTGISWTSISRGIMGMLFLFGLGYLFSKNRKNINWKLVVRGTGLQVALALLILKVPFISIAFDWLSKAFTKIINFSHDGANFLFRSLGTEQIHPMLMNFMTWILPSIIFFAALSSLLYYFGILQWIIKRLAWVMNKTLGISGAESISAAANIFIGLDGFGNKYKLCIRCPHLHLPSCRLQGYLLQVSP